MEPVETLCSRAGGRRVHGVETKNAAPGDRPRTSGHTAVIILGHGSRAEDANDGMYQVIECLQAKRPEFRFMAGFLEINSPSVPEAIDKCAESGAERVILLPYFLHLGNHVQKDLPKILNEGRKRHSHVQIILAAHLGFHSKLVEIAEERLSQSIESDSPLFSRPHFLKSFRSVCSLWRERVVWLYKKRMPQNKNYLTESRREIFQDNPPRLW